jgi:hypothetical protein
MTQLGEVARKIPPMLPVPIIPTLIWTLPFNLYASAMGSSCSTEDADSRYKAGCSPRLGGQFPETFGAHKDFIVLLRPDNHIALVSPQVSLDVQEYLAEFIGHGATADR